MMLGASSRRWAAAIVSVMALGALLLGAAGCAGGSGGVVAVVGGKAISRASFDHWMAVAAVKDYQPMPQAPVPKGVLPDPPDYVACSAHLASIAPHGVGVPVPSATALKRQCAQQYRALREQVMGSLITAEWLIGEGEARGLKALPSEILKRTNRLRKSDFANERTFQRYLTYSGETIADRMFRSKIKVFSEKIEHQLSTNLGSRAGAQAVANFATRLVKRWPAKTSCRPHFIVPDCREYKGPIAPELRLL
jgi:hypothetical protein